MNAIVARPQVQFEQKATKKKIEGKEIPLQRKKGIEK